MNIKPMTSYKKPSYPTYQESKEDAQLLKNLPQRWGKNGSIASLIGTGILIHVAGTGRGEDAATENVTVSIIEPVEHERGTVTNAVRTIPATRVAPMLEAALANDGRGSFGCVAVAAPVFLSENEAMDLIEAELEKAGLKVKDLVTVDGLNIPDANAKSESLSGLGKRDKEEERDWRKFKMKKLTEGPYTFDLGTEDKSVVIKFLRTRDYDHWRDNQGIGSSVSVYDLPTFATQVSDAFKARTNGTPVVIGLFFDPMASAKWKDNAADIKAQSREKLRAQVLHFVEYLKKEGVVF